MSDFLTRNQVAGLLGVTVKYFLEIRDGELKAKHFPPATLGTRANERWDPLVIQAWRKSQIPAELRAIAEAGPQDPEAAAAAELDRRAEALARGEKVH